MSGGWTEDPELVKLRDSGAENAQARQQRVSQAKEELDSFVRRYGAMISGGVRKPLMFCARRVNLVTSLFKVQRNGDLIAGNLGARSGAIPLLCYISALATISNIEGYFSSKRIIYI